MHPSIMAWHGVVTVVYEARSEQVLITTFVVQILALLLNVALQQ
jgi:hypothetical protein